MTVYVGGTRARLIRDAVFYTVRDSMIDLGWQDSGREHMPVEFIPEPLENDEEIQPNLIALDDDNISDIPLELGSGYSEQRWDMVFDVYAEDASMGRSLAIDIRDILLGKFHSIGRVAPVIDVYDTFQDVPPVIFRCELENISYDRMRSGTKSWQKNWFVVFVTVIDQYASDTQDEEVSP